MSNITTEIFSYKKNKEKPFDFNGKYKTTNADIILIKTKTNILNFLKDSSDIELITLKNIKCQLIIENNDDIKNLDYYIDMEIYSQNDFKLFVKDETIEENLISSCLIEVSKY